jgi:hypothetical protein
MNILQKLIQKLQIENANLREELQKLQEVSKAEIRAAEKVDLKELPGKRGEAAHNKLHKLLGKYLKKK